MSTHTGTHLDAPAHFARGRWSVADIPLDRLVDVSTCVIDVADKVVDNDNYEVSVADVHENERDFGAISPNSIVLIRTNWSRHWAIRSDYFGTSTRDTSMANFPGLSVSAARWLVANRAIYGVGIEGPSIDCGQNDGLRSHAALAAANVFIIENVNDAIAQLPPRGSKVTVAPLRITSASGSPVRMYAKLYA